MEREEGTRIGTIRASAEVSSFDVISESTKGRKGIWEKSICLEMRSN